MPTESTLRPRAVTFHRRGVVEGFFGPPWATARRLALFKLGAGKGMNTYLYAPKDDPYHRERWDQAYPEPLWSGLCKLITVARHHGIDFVYGFHPGKNLCFSSAEPVRRLVRKAQRLYDNGVRTFAILFDDIPSKLELEEDRKAYRNSLARAEATWVCRVMDESSKRWPEVEWWFCPSLYTEDPVLPRMFGAFEEGFWETVARHLPENVACFWTGPSVVPKTVTLAHARSVFRRLRHPLILWDNYPVNDLSMSRELHLGPLMGRDPRLPEVVYGYLNNPMLQPTLSLLPLATCFDYAADPRRYRPEKSWERAVSEQFGTPALGYWKAIRKFCEGSGRAQTSGRARSRLESRLSDARRYLERHRGQLWFRELRPWREQIIKSLELDPRQGIS
jgi:hyaluronoglucosaminidase